MKVGNIVKWYTDTAHFSLVSGIVIDTYMNEGDPVATVFWFVTQNRQNIITTRLTIISEA
jgi:hypothetical protein